ncbi:hypothetical protein JD844_013072 [Phrynosoma platyrhinos]|uniref:PRA1 family protein 3 n=1 Tax=Phrynosoma platyrhinos TaxID=52577 RepID=A0ABQ7TL69_PHRPL|nr:hypothetical protein JD844_013072 [Phrynosoma platyrhinos]
MVLGAAVVILVFLTFVWASHNKDFIRKFKKHYPFAFVIAIMLLSYFLISFFGGVMVFMFGITFPLFCLDRVFFETMTKQPSQMCIKKKPSINMIFFLAVMFVHASLRLRNIKNKVENKMESIGLKKTPMGIILDLLEQQEEGFTKLADYLAKAKE